MIAEVFTLFLVTNGADVKHSDYRSLRQCQEAKSLAVWGKTIAQKLADDDLAEQKRKQEEAERKKKDDEFAKAHPPRPVTKADRQWQFMTHELPDKSGYEYIDGDLVMARRGLFYSAGQVISVSSWQSPNGIRTAECVVVPK